MFIVFYPPCRKTLDNLSKHTQDRQLSAARSDDPQNEHLLSGENISQCHLDWRHEGSEHHVIGKSEQHAGMHRDVVRLRARGLGSDVGEELLYGEVHQRESLSNGSSTTVQILLPCCVLEVGVDY